MSKKGIDFEKGGFYFRDKNNKKLNIEDNLELGDSGYSMVQSFMVLKL